MKFKSKSKIFFILIFLLITSTSNIFSAANQNECACCGVIIESGTKCQDCTTPCDECGECKKCKCPCSGNCSITGINGPHIGVDGCGKCKKCACQCSECNCPACETLTKYEICHENCSPFYCNIHHMCEKHCSCFKCTCDPCPRRVKYEGQKCPECHTCPRCGKCPVEGHGCDCPRCSCSECSRLVQNENDNCSICNICPNCSACKRHTCNCGNNGGGGGGGTPPPQTNPEVTIEIYDYNDEILSDVEKINPGLFMRLNCDDDNGNDIIDKFECENYGYSGFNDDDLIKVFISVYCGFDSNGDPYDGNVTITRSNKKIKLYKPTEDGNKKETDVFGENISKTYNIEDFENYFEGIFYMDGYELGESELELTFHGKQDDAKITVIGAEAAVDGNRDGVIKFDKENDRALIFWVNNDHDVVDDGEEDDEVGDANCNDNVISCKRDLEDFARIHFKFFPTDGSVKYYVKLTGGPEINLFENIDPDGSNLYLTSESVANNQLNKYKIMTIDSTEKEITLENINNNDISCYLFEGSQAGEGELIITSVKDDEVLTENKIIIRLIEPNMLFDYYKVTCSDSENNIVNSVATFEYSSSFPHQNDDYLLFVHGWNMAGEWEKKRWAETIFKRLYWLGYKGKVGLFSWPEMNQYHYDRSEVRGWRSGVALKSVLQSINGNVCMLAHSQGNVVASESLYLNNGTLVNTFISTQAAISGHCFDETLNTYWSNFTTPDIYGSYPGTGNPYLVNAKNNANKRVRFYNVDDFALVNGTLGLDWEGCNKLKPDNWYNYDNNNGNLDLYIQGNDRFYYGYLIPGVDRTLLFSNDRHEIFAFCAESRATALGAESSSVSWFNNEINLQGNDYGYDDKHYSHSRQFRSSIQKEWKYWEKVTEEANFNLIEINNNP